MRLLVFLSIPWGTWRKMAHTHTHIHIPLVTRSAVFRWGHAGALQSLTGQLGVQPQPGGACMSFCDGENELQVFFSPGPEALLPPASLLPFPAHGAKGQDQEALFSQSLTQLPVWASVYLLCGLEPSSWAWMSSGAGLCPSGVASFHKKRRMAQSCQSNSLTSFLFHKIWLEWCAQVSCVSFI